MCPKCWYSDDNPDRLHSLISYGKKGKTATKGDFWYNRKSRNVLLITKQFVVSFFYQRTHLDVYSVYILRLQLKGPMKRLQQEWKEFSVTLSGAKRSNMII